MDTTSTPQTIVGVLVTRTYDHVLAGRVAECGDTFRYETHLSAPVVRIQVSCLCPAGHGVAGLPWRGWLSTETGRFDLADIPAPVRAARYQSTPDTFEVPEDLLDDPEFAALTPLAAAA